MNADFKGKGKPVEDDPWDIFPVLTYRHLLSNIPSVQCVDKFQTTSLCPILSDVFGLAIL
jgi:hypothetical protein